MEGNEEGSFTQKAAAVACAEACILGTSMNKDEPWKQEANMGKTPETELLTQALSGIFAAALRILKARGRYAYNLLEIPKGH